MAAEQRSAPEIGPVDVSFPVPKDELARLDALRTYNVLDTPPEREFDELVRLAAQVCDCPLAAITLVDETRQWFKARIGLEADHTPRTADGLCTNAIMSRELVQIPDTVLNPTFDNAWSTRGLGVRFYAGAPLVNREDLVLGTLCVLDRRPRVLRPEQLESLGVIARQVMAQLELRRLALVGEFRERLVSILSHDLRQPVQKILLAARQGLGPLVAGAPEHRALTQIAISAERLTRMVRDVLDFTQTRLGNGLAVKPRTARLHMVCRQLVQEFALSYPGRPIELELAGDATGEWDEDRLTQALSNLLANALRYGAKDQPVRLSCVGTEQVVTLAVWNGGPPIAPDVLPRLFAPFCRTSSTPEADAPLAGLGLGLFIVREVAIASGGKVEARSTAEGGTTFRLILPRRLAQHAGVVRSLLRH
jgi:sigma-B regulation protein RsbU (phosphoserine phosphatase)